MKGQYLLDSKTKKIQLIDSFFTEQTLHLEEGFEVNLDYSTLGKLLGVESELLGEENPDKSKKEEGQVDSQLFFDKYISLVLNKHYNFNVFLSKNNRHFKLLESLQLHKFQTHSTEDLEIYYRTRVENEQQILEESQVADVSSVKRIDLFENRVLKKQSGTR